MDKERASPRSERLTPSEIELLKRDKREALDTLDSLSGQRLARTSDFLKK